MVVLVGEAGIGKTRLAEELLTWVGRQGIVTASAHCYEALGALPYAPVATWLRVDALRSNLSALAPAWRSEVARLLPDLLESDPHLPRPGLLTEGWQRQRLFEALARALLSGSTPRVLHLDDLQWCDRETLEWLHYLLRFDLKAPLLLVGTMRAEEMPDSSALASLLSSLRRDGLVTEIEPGPLDAAETAFLASQVAGSDLTSPEAAVLYHETEGNPLFVVETIRAGKLDSDMAVFPSTEYGSVPHPSHTPQTVRAVIVARLAQLSPPAHELINLAAVIGRAFTFAVLAQASGADEDTLVSGLDELWQRRIVREQGQDAYDFSHDKIREVAYTAISAARRRLLHRRVAEALERGHGGSLDTVSGQIAAHFERAGRVEKAISYHRRAGEVAQQVSANQEALAAFQQALALLGSLPPGQAPREWKQETATALNEQIGNILSLTGQVDRARVAYRSALSQVPGHQCIWQARLYRKLGKTALSPLNSEEAFAACESAETALRNTPDDQAEEVWQEWIQVQFDRMWLYHVQARIQEVSDLVEKVQPAVETYGTPVQMATYYVYVFTRNFRCERYVISEETLASAEAALKACQQSGNASLIAQAQFTYAFCKTWHGDLEEGEEQFYAGLQTAERIGDALLQAQCLTYLGIALRRLGQIEETRRVSSQALAKATEVQRPEYIGTATSNLGWVAWRLGHMDECREKSLEALELWRQLPLKYPFSWTALLPLMSVALAKRRVSEAIEYTRLLLLPDQQRLPDVLTATLEAAIHAWDAGQSGSARSHLQQAAASAQEMGYL